MKKHVDPLKEDFRKFLFVVWRHLKLPNPTKRQYAVARYLQTGPRRRVVQAFRGMGKSWVTAAFVLWNLYCNPKIKILVVSASKVRADNFTTFCLQLIRVMDILQHLAPTEEQRCSKTMFDVALATPDQQPSVTSLGITSALAGNRADLIVGDDIEVLNNSATITMREKLSEAIKEFDAILKPNGHVVFLGTPQTEESVYSELSKRGYDTRIWPARYPGIKLREFYGPKLCGEILAELLGQPSLEGHTTEGVRFSDEDLAQRERSYGKAGFALQFMLDTSLSDIDRYPLRLQDLVVWSLPEGGAPDRLFWTNNPAQRADIQCVGLAGDRLYWGDKDKEAVVRPFSGVIMAIDPGGRGADETAYAVVAHLNGTLYLLDAGAVHGYSEDALQTLARLCKDWKVNRVIIEANMGDGMFTELIKPVLLRTVEKPVGVEEVKHSIQKERRICDTLEPIFAQHRLVVNSELFGRDIESVSDYPPESAMHYSLFFQLTRMTREKGAVRHDDRADALQMGVAYWVKVMAQDPSTMAATRLREDKEKVHRDFEDWWRKKGHPLLGDQPCFA